MPSLPCDFSPFCGHDDNPFSSTPLFVFSSERLLPGMVQIRRVHAPRVPRADAAVGSASLSQVESTFDGLVASVSDLRQRIRDSHLYGFLSHASEEIALSYGEESLQAKVWDFFGENAVQTVTQTLEGDLTTAGVNLVQAVLKPAKVLSKLGVVDKIKNAARGLGNPFKGKSAAQIDEMFRKKGVEPRGPDPAGGKGGYVNPETNRSYHIDEANSFGEPPHVDVNRPRTYDGDLPKKKYPFGD